MHAVRSMCCTIDKRNGVFILQGKGKKKHLVCIGWVGVVEWLV